MFNRSLIFKNAWIVKRKHNYTFSKSLKISWKYEKEKLKNFQFERVIKELSGSLSYHSNYIASKSYSISKEEAKQKLMIKVFNSLGKYDEKKSSLKSFYSTVLKRYSFDILRKEYSKEPEGFAEISSIKDDKDHISKFEIKESLKNCYKRLDKTSKIILEKMSIGMKAKEIAEDLGFSSNNVSNIIRRKIRPELVGELC